MHPLTCASRSDHAHRVASAASIYVTMHGFISSLETIMWATLLLSFVLKFCHAACTYDGWGYYALPLIEGTLSVVNLFVGCYGTSWFD